MTHRSRAANALILLLLAAVALGLGILLRRLAVDDAYITYRYAHNAATGQGFVYNPGRQVLSTTAPLFALILAAGSLLWPDLPALANALSSVCLGLAALLLFLLARREGQPAAGGLTALLLVTSPLLWLSLGLETALFLALALAAILAYRRRQMAATAALLALLTLTRGDGLILTAVIAADRALGWLIERDSSEVSQNIRSVLAARGRTILGAAAVYVVVVLPLLAWLTWQFGSPLPATLRAKVAQSELGVTGFYAHTTYLQGLWIILRARWAQSPLYSLYAAAALAGLAVTWRVAWARLIVAWGAAHLIGYSLLGVTPYYWYYAPLVPALACVAGVGIVHTAGWLTRRPRRHPVIGRLASGGMAGLWAAALLFALFRSDLAMIKAIDGPVPQPEDPVSKVLPEAKAGVYKQAGEWLREHTPADATVGVTEVGVMGYYADRTMVDFLGLLEPDVAQALGRGDLYWALLYYQPDYLALTAVSPLYAYDLRADSWFQVAYTPVDEFADSRFWGSPVTVYQRRVPRVEMADWSGRQLPEEARELDANFAGQIRLMGAVVQDSAAHAGDILPLTLYWQAIGPIPRDYTVFVHLLGQYDRVIAQRDAAPGLGARPTSGWTAGQIIADPYLIALPEATYAPDQAVWEVGVYDTQTGQRLQTPEGGDNVRWGAVSIAPRPAPLHLDFGPIALAGYGLDRLALKPGEQLQVTLDWAGVGPVGVKVKLWSEAGELAAMAEGRSQGGQEHYSLAPLAGMPPGAYDLEVSVYGPAEGNLLPLLGVDGQPVGDGARLTKVRIYP